MTANEKDKIRKEEIDAEFGGGFYAEPEETGKDEKPSGFIIDEECSSTEVPDFIPLDEIDQWEHDVNENWFKKGDT